MSRELRNKRTAHSRGFTLIEVILALIVLAAGLSIIIGLQASAVTQSLRDRDRVFALLAGRQILAHYEADETNVQIKNEDGSLYELLENVDAIQKNDYDPADQQRLREFQAHVAVQDIGIPGVDVEVLRKITLTISWGKSALDSVELIYFVPAPPPQGS